MRTRFAEFVLDSERRALEGARGPVHITAKAFSLLEVLLAERPRVVSRRELLDRVWPDVVVAVENVKNVVFELRTALGDDGDSRFIRTVHGFGYAFAAEASEERGAHTAARHWIHYGAQALPILNPVMEVGRDQQCGICIDAPGVSRRHARIVVSESGVTVEDLGSKNGTCVGRMRIKGAVPLHNGDRIRLGLVTLTFRTSASVESTMTEPSET